MSLLRVRVWRSAVTVALLVCGVAIHGSAAAAATPRMVKVMPLGDSITWGIGSRALSPSSYRADLRARLTGAGLAVDFVGSGSGGLPATDNQHEGHPGWTTTQITRRVDGWLATYRPDVVLLQIGTNDVKDPATAPGAAARLAVLVDRVRTRVPAAHIFVAKITGSAMPSVQARINTYNASIPAILSRRGPRVHLVDHSMIGGLNLRDWLHPNDVGYAKLSYNWYRAMRSVFQGSGRVWPAGVNPYAATRAYLCINHPRTTGGKVACNWWQLRGVSEKRWVVSR